MPEKKLEYAFRFASVGVRVFPQTTAKTPPAGFADWPTRASCDPTVITEWAKQFPGCNFAAVVGERSGKVVIDVDIKNGGAGFDSLRAMIGDRALPPTMQVRTGSGGKHLWFNIPAGVRLKTVKEMAKYPNVELLSAEHAVTLPGSVYEDGREYVVEENEFIFADIPDWLLAEWKNANDTQTNANEASRAKDSNKQALNGGDSEPQPDMATVWRSWINKNFPEVKWNGDEGQVCCPFHDDTHPSCSVNVIKQLFYCHASGCLAHGGLMKLAIQKGSDVPVAAVVERPARAPAQAAVLVDLCEEMEFFSWADVAYATLQVGQHLETWPLRTTAFREILSQRYYLMTDSVPNADAIEGALGVLRGRALWDGRQIPVHVRLGGDDARTFLDLGDPDWRCVEVTDNGWQIIDGAEDIRFRRPKGLLQLPEPVAGGSLMELLPFLNSAGHEDAQLLLAWLVAALRPNAKYPVLGLSGEQGSGKSTVARRLRELVDPNLAVLRASPRAEDDLAIAAHNGWVINLDNLSHIPDWLSDGVCRLSGLQAHRDHLRSIA